MVARGMRRQGPVDRFDEAVGEDLRNPEARSMDTSLLEGLLGGDYVQTGRARGGLRTKEDVEASEARARSIGEHALTALVALILPQVLPGGAAYGAAGGLAGGLRAMGQRAGGYKIPGSDAPGFVPPAGSVQAGASSFMPGIGGRFWGSGRAPGMSGRQPTVTQGQTMMNRTSDLGNTRLPGVPGPNRPQPEYTPSPGASFHGMTGTPIRNHPQFVSGPQGTTRIPGRSRPQPGQGAQAPRSRAEIIKAVEDAYIAKQGQTGLAAMHPSLRRELLYGRSEVAPYKPSVQSFMDEMLPADIAGATGRQIAGRGFPGRSAGPPPAEKAVQEIIARNNLRTGGKTREQMGLKKPDPHPGHNPNAPAHENAWDHLSAKLNISDRQAWEIVQSLDDIAMQEIMHISPTIGGNVPFWPR